MSRDQQPIRDISEWLDRTVFGRLYGKKASRVSPAVNRQNIAETIIARQLTEMALARFKWEGLPTSADALWIEHLLLVHGSALFAIHPSNSAQLALQPVPLGQPNYQNEYAVFNGMGINYQTTKHRTIRSYSAVKGEVVVDNPTGVIIYNNATRTGDLPLIRYYAERLAELDTTIDINSANARRNKVVYANQNTEFAVNNILSEIASGEPYIKLREGMAPIEQIIGTLDLSVHPDSIDRLHIFRGRLFNEAMMTLGIDNTNQDKKERMVTDEIGGNNDQIARIRSAALNQRRKAARAISTLIDSPVTVDYFTIDDPANDPQVMRMEGESE